ncbi:MAG: E2 ligase fold family C protein [Blastocatellia bacterium]|nr:E2 ligase fold family C protein [Blastocatellia bacterium]
MAIANFFDKAALGASQILNGIDAESLADRLQDITVAIAFDSAAIASSEGRLTLEMSVSLLSRFYPQLYLRPLDERARKHVAELTGIAIAINPDIELVDHPEASTFFLVVGSSKICDAGEVPQIYLGSDKWIVRVSNAGPVGSNDSNNPFGAGAAACLGVANIFRWVFRDTLELAELDEELTLSLFDFEVNAQAPWNPEIVPAEIGELHLVGVGAIGNATVWALARTTDLSGVLHLIDQEQVDLTNLQRYALATQEDVDRFKVERAAAEFNGSQIKAVPHKQKWGQYQREHQNWHLGRVAVAVDNAEDRRAVQASLPRRVTNSWTQTGDLGISRHDSFGNDPCLACLYFPEEGGKNLDEIVAAAIGLPEANMEIRALLQNNTPVGRQMIERIARALSVPVEPLLRFADQPLHTFYTQAICGGIVMKLGGKIGAHVQSAEVPMAFQSVMAGIMLAAELIADACKSRQTPLTTTSRIDLLHPMRGYINRPEVKLPSGLCLCQDQDYVEAYRAKYDLSHSQFHDLFTDPALPGGDSGCDNY